MKLLSGPYQWEQGALQEGEESCRIEEALWERPQYWCYWKQGFMEHIAEMASDSIILWHADPLLSNDREIDRYTTAVARQWLCKRLLLGNGHNRLVTRNNGVTWKWCSLHSPCNSYMTQQQNNWWESCFLCDPCWGVISRTSLRVYLVVRQSPARTWTWKLRKLWCWKPI
jgi:hypothetical protein